MRSFRVRITPGVVPTDYPIMSIEVFVKAATTMEAQLEGERMAKRTWKEFYVSTQELLT